MQIKTTVRYYFSYTGMDFIKKTGNNKCWQKDGEIRTFMHHWREHKIVQLLWKILWLFLKKINIGLLYNPGILLLGT